MLYVNHTQLVKVTDGEEPPSESYEDDSVSQEASCDFSVVYDELQRKQTLLFSAWAAVDQKIGLILGFAVVVLFGLVLSSDVVNLTVASTSGMPPLNLTYLIFWQFFSYYACMSHINLHTIPVAFISSLILLYAFISFLVVAFLGASALHIKVFDDTDTIPEIKRFAEKRNREEFKQRLGKSLYQSINGYEEIIGDKTIKHPGNDEIIRKKAAAARLMIYGFVIGTVLFVVRFGIIILISLLR